MGVLLLCAVTVLFNIAPSLAQGSFSEFIRPVNTPGKPSWLLFHAGTVVYVGPDPTIPIGAPSHIYCHGLRSALMQRHAKNL